MSADISIRCGNKMWAIRGNTVGRGGNDPARTPLSVARETWHYTRYGEHVGERIST